MPSWWNSTRNHQLLTKSFAQNLEEVQLMARKKYPKIGSSISIQDLTLKLGLPRKTPNCSICTLNSGTDGSWLPRISLDAQTIRSKINSSRKMLRRACKFLSISCNTSFVNKIKPKVMSELLNRPIEGLSKSLSAVSTTEKPHTFRDFICHVFSQSPAWIRNSQEAKDVQKVLSSFMQAITVEK